MLTAWLKERWALILIVAVVAVLLSIPAKTGLPDRDYTGCKVEGSQCYTANIKSVSNEPDGSVLIVVPINFENGQPQDLPLSLKNDHGRILPGSGVFMNFVGDEYMVLFIERDTKFLWNVFSFLFDAKQSSTATVSLQTLQEL